MKFPLQSEDNIHRERSWGGGGRRWGGRCSFPNGGLLVRIRATGAVKSTPDEVTSSPSQLQCFTDLRTSLELSPLTPPRAWVQLSSSLPLSLLWTFECMLRCHLSEPPNFMFQAKLADFITIQVKIAVEGVGEWGSSFGFLLKAAPQNFLLKKREKKEQQRDVITGRSRCKRFNRWQPRHQANSGS